MRKNKLFYVLSVALLFMLGFVININIADASELSFDSNSAPGEISIDVISIEDELDMEQDELYAGYLDKVFGVNNDIYLFSVNNYDNTLTNPERTVYNKLIPELKKIADGESDSALISISFKDIYGKTQFTAGELGVDTDSSTFNDDISAKLNEKINISYKSILIALVNDCPYELYWFDKTKGIDVSFSGYFENCNNGEENTYGFSEDSLVKVGFFVGIDYSKNNIIKSFDVDTSKTSAAIKALSNAKTIVANAKNLSDYEKLVYYKDQICGLVSYNKEAASLGSEGYNSILPWHMMYVFDKDPDTNVVCEGYSKAFKYLCDLTTFTSDEIYTGLVSGLMDGGGHMWNIVHMDDGKNYLADITNCDEGTSGSPDYLFLKNGDAKLYDNSEFAGYRIDIPRRYITETSYYEAKSINYIYDSSTLDNFYIEDLELSTTEYSKPVVHSYTVTLTATSLTYTGSARKPGITVKDEMGKTLVLNTDYSVKYYDSTDSVVSPVDIGTYKIKITMKGDYSGSVTKSYKITPSAMSQAKPVMNSDSITVKWTKNVTGSGYLIYRSVNGGKYSLYKTINSNTTTSFKDTSGIENGNKYQYKIFSFKTVNNIRYTGPSSVRTIYFVNVPVAKLSNVASGVKISIEGNSKASGYYIYRSVDGGKTYKKLVTLSANDSTSVFINSSANTNGSKYCYKVFAYKLVDNATYISASSGVKNIYFISRPGVGLANTSTGVKVSWGKNTKGTGYYIYRSVDGGKSYQKIKTISDSTVTSYVDTTAKTNGSLYYYKVFTFKKVNNVTYNSAGSQVKSYYY